MRREAHWLDYSLSIYHTPNRKKKQAGEHCLNMFFVSVFICFPSLTLPPWFSLSNPIRIVFLVLSQKSTLCSIIFCKNVFLCLQHLKKNYPLKNVSNYQIFCCFPARDRTRERKSSECSREYIQYFVFENAIKFSSEQWILWKKCSVREGGPPNVILNLRLLSVLWHLITVWEIHCHCEMRPNETYTAR